MNNICRVCNASMDGRDVICVMPTGDRQRAISEAPSNAHSPRRRKVTDLSVAGRDVSWMYYSHITSDIPNGKHPDRIHSCSYLDQYTSKADQVHHMLEAGGKA